MGMAKRGRYLILGHMLAPLGLALAMTMLASCSYQTPVFDNPVDPGYEIPASAQAVTAPEFAPSGGSSLTAITISLSSSTPEAKICYTSDGSPPLPGKATLYDAPFVIDSTLTLRAIAFRSSWKNSPENSATYTIGSLTGVEPAVMSPPAGTYSSDQSVTLSCATSGADIFYTTDGSVPTTNSTPYRGAIAVAGDGTTMTIRAVAYKVGLTDSAFSSGTYTIISNATAMPIFSPDDGAYTGAQSITLSSTTVGAAIRYTTDGSTPTSTMGLLYSAPIVVSASQTIIKAIAYKSGMSDSGVATAVYMINAAMVPSPTGTVANSGDGEVTLSWNAVSGATSYNVYYQAGTTATTLSTQAPTTMIAGTVAVITGLTNGTQYAFVVTASAAMGSSPLSVIVTAVPSATPAAATPTFNPASGTYATAQSVTISSTTAGASIRYTTDGSIPTSTTGALYAGAVSVATSQTVRAMAIKAGWTDSSVASATYTITPASSSVSATLTALMPNDQVVSFSGTMPTLAFGSTMTVSASTAASPDAAFQWWLDDAVIPAATSNSVIIGTGLAGGSHSLVFLFRIQGTWYSEAVHFAVLGG